MIVKEKRDIYSHPSVHSIGNSKSTIFAKEKKTLKA